MKLRLYHYWRSSASWRVRWALAIKGIRLQSSREGATRAPITECELIPVNLLAGEQKSQAYLQKNPAGVVPTLEIMRDGKKSQFLSESLAIIEWGEENFPKPNLLPKDPWERGRVRQLAQLINAGIQPLQNLKVAAFYSEDEAKKKSWNQHWIKTGLSAYETLVKQTAGQFSVGDSITIADLCLIPQCYSARRFDVDIAAYPTIARIEQAALATEACQQSHNDRYKPQ